MKRKKIIKIIDKFKKKGYVLTGEKGIFKALGKALNKSNKTIQTYYYADKSRPKGKV